MKKPITIARHDTLDAVVKTLNESGLPAFVQVDILEDVLRELERLERIEYARDLKTYMETEGQPDE